MQSLILAVMEGIEIVSLTLADGSKTAVSVFEGLDQNLPIVVFFPAMGVKATYYEGLAKYFQEQGLTCITADQRALGLSEVPAPPKSNFGYSEMLLNDYQGVLNFLRDRFQGRKILLGGHSLGGQLSCLYTARFPEGIDGLLLISSCSVYYKTWGGNKLKLLASTQMLGLFARILGYHAGEKIGFGGHGAKGTLIDWSNQSRTGMYRLLNDDFDYDSAMKNIRLPMLVVEVEGDDFAPRSAIDHLVGKMNAQTDYHLLEHARSSKGSWSHFNWARQPDVIGSDLVSWIKNKFLSA